MAKISFEKFLDFFTYYNAEVHQNNAIRLLYNNLEASLEDNATWINAYRDAPEDPEIDTILHSTTEGMTTSKAGIDLIKAFEGCELTRLLVPGRCADHRLRPHRIGCLSRPDHHRRRSDGDAAGGPQPL